MVHFITLSVYLCQAKDKALQQLICVAEFSKSKVYYIDKVTEESALFWRLELP